MRRVVKGAVAGRTVGADEVSRHLTPAQRAALVIELSGEAEERAAALLADARAAAAAILDEAEAEAEAVRARARTEGYTAGHADGRAAAMAELESTAALLRRGAEAGEAIRAALLEGAEEQVVALALTAARRVVDTAADRYADLAAEIVRRGIRAATGRILRIRVNPAEVESVTAEVLRGGVVYPVQPDGAVMIGGCIIDLEGGIVDLRIETQFADVMQAFLDAA